MTYTRPSYVALAMLAGTAIVPAHATMMGAPSPPTISVPRVTPPTVRPPSINIPNVTPGGGINTNIRDNMRTNRGARGSDSGRSTKRSNGSGKSYSDEGRANRSGGDSSASRAKVGGQAAAAAAAGAADSPGDGSKAAYQYSDQIAAKYDMDNCDPSDGNYVPPSSKNYAGPKPIATLMPVDLPPTIAPPSPSQGGTMPGPDDPATPLAPVDPTSMTGPSPPPVANVDGGGSYPGPGDNREGDRRKSAGDDPLAGLIDQNNNNGPTVSNPPDPNAPIQVATGDKNPTDPNAPQSDASTGSTKPTTPTTSDDKPDEPTDPIDAQIKVLQAEINKRLATNNKLDQVIKEGWDVDQLKAYFKDAPIDATGKTNPATFNKLPPEVQREMKEFEKSIPGKNIAQAMQDAGGALSQTFSPGSFYLNHGRVEMKRNEWFIQQLQAKIADLKASK